MSSDKDILTEITELASLFLSPDEIAILLDLDDKTFFREIRLRKGEMYKAYFLGKTESKKEIHENVVKLAKHGSPQAEEMAQKMIINQEQAERAKT